jgi:D-alanyl-D-alanine carboxypeptidase
MECDFIHDASGGAKDSLVARRGGLAHNVLVRISRFPRYFNGVHGALVLPLCLAWALAALPLPSRAAGGEPAIRAYVVADDKTGHILAESHSKDKLQVGSLTKIATALVVLDWVRLGGHGLDEVVAMPADPLLAELSTNPIGFQPGDTVTLRDLLYAALLQSDNVAANALADHVGAQLPASAEASAKISPVDRFVFEMNALAQSQGMARTRFLNPSGLDNKERPYSTAADLGRLTHLAMSKADFRFFVAQKERKITLTRAGVASEYLLRNTNELLGINRVDGVKTGQTARAGSCVIISAARDPIVVLQAGRSVVTPRRLIVVVLGAANRFEDAGRLLEQGVSLYDQWAASGYPANPKETL